MQRKLLVEKRVVLDDIPTADRKSDRLLATLPPRSPTIQRDEDGNCVSRLHTSKSEYNVSGSKSSSLPHSARPQSTRARLATSISVGNSLSSAAGRPGHSDVFGSWKVHDINEVREPQNVNNFPQPGRVNSDELTNAAKPAFGRVNSAAAGSSQQARTGVHSAASGLKHARTDHGPQKHVATADNAQSVSRGTRPRSVPPKLSHQPLQVHDTQCSDAMGAQYEPGNVRHLVQTFQSAFRPATTAVRGDVAVDHSSKPAGDSHQVSTAKDRLQTADRQYRRQAGGDMVQDQQWPSSRRNLHMVPPRTETNVNVCVVRPATGRTLPRPPNQDHSQPLAASGPSVTGEQELTNELGHSDTQSTNNKVNKLWQAYGCL